MKKKYYFLTIFVSVLFFIGCTSLPKSPISQRSQWSNPKIGVTATAYIGDSVIIEGIEDAYETIRLKENHGSLGWTAFHPAGLYKYCGTEEVEINYTGKNEDNGTPIYKKETVKEYCHDKLYSNGWKYVYPSIYKSQDGTVYLNTNTGVKKLKKEEYTESRLYEESGYYFEQQLLYTGAEGNILKFSYREFQNDKARAAFTVDATYDISKDKILRFKQCSLEVISVNNQSITYKLLSGFKTNN